MQVHTPHHDGQGDQMNYLAKILVVDDEPDIVEEVIDQLELEGLPCASAFNALSAIDMLESDPDIGIVVTDIRMPGMDGLEMARNIKKGAGKTRDVLVILVTGHAGMQEAIEALQIGAEDFLTKPISAEHLLHAVQRAEEMIRHRRNERDFQERLVHEVDLKTAALMESHEKLKSANEIKDQFLSAMGHELRTPLNAINGFSELLKQKLTGAVDDKAIEYIDMISDSSDRLGGTIENILEFTETVSGNRTANMDKQVLGDVLDHVTGMVRRQAAEKDIEIQRGEAFKDSEIRSDLSMLSKALSCILDNAIKFSPEGVAIKLDAERKDDSVIFSIADQGCGMSEEEISVSMEPFRQVDGSLARPAEGSGLSLSLAVLLTELQGGHIDIDSSPGKGTTVSIVLPQGGGDEYCK